MRILPGLDKSNLDYIAKKCETLNETLNQQDLPLGTAYIAIGLFYVSLYVPCMIGILNPANFKLPCYKIMSVMGFIDILTLSLGIISGFFSVLGSSACNATTFMIICGNCVMGFWTTYCAVSIYLGINRCGDVYGSDFMETIFTGYRTWLFMLIPLSFGISVLLFGPTMYYNTTLGSWFFGLDPNKELGGNMLQLSVNSLATLIILSQYAAITIRLCVVTRSDDAGTKLSPVAKKVLLQTFLISLPLLTASSMYILIQFIPVPPMFTIILEITWQSCHGGMAIIYLIFNNSMRPKILDLLCCHKTTKKQVMPLRTAPRTTTIQVKSVCAI